MARRWTLPGNSGSFLIARAEDRPSTKEWRRVPAMFARAAVEHALASGASAVHDLHEAVGGAPRSGLSRSALDEHRRQVARRVGEAFRSGALVAYRRLPPAMPVLPEEPLAPERPFLAEPISEEPENYIHIRLVGEDDVGLPGIRYRLLLPDQSIREGTLDGAGSAIVRGRFSGTCKVSFPELDAHAWEPV
jgi:hypothetical protein